MPCNKCKTNPNYHSFVRITNIDDTDVFYSSISKCQDSNEDGTKFKNIKIHVDEETTRPWIWVIDFANMEMKHYTDPSFNNGMFEMISNNDAIKEIWFFRSNIWIRTTIALFKKISNNKILNNIYFFDETGLELLDKLQKKSLNIRSIQWLMSQ